MAEYSDFLEFVAVLQAAPEVISGCTQFPALEFRAADIHFYPGIRYTFKCELYQKMAKNGVSKKWGQSTFFSNIRIKCALTPFSYRAAPAC
jgi:hypothetical protein